MGNANELSTECAETKVDDGIAFIEGASPLTRLHFFDGKFLKADALSQEQAYHRTRVQLSNLAGGWGVVNGLGIDLVGNVLSVTGGLAITPAGNFVMSVSGAKASLDDLIKVAEKAPPEGNADFQPCVTDQGKAKGGSTTASGLQIFEITVGPIDALCGNEPVFGKLCESACVSDSRHPWWREGMVLRLRPISLKLPSSATPLTTTHLRNRIASAYFALEPGSTRDLLSRAGLQGDGWCGTASLYGRDEIVLGLLSRDGASAHIDSWSARRERMDSQARGYWQGRMAMRPWNVYLAQILQFQCQLSAVLDGSTGAITPTGDCDDLREALAKARKELDALQKKYAASANKMVERLGGKVTKADTQWAIDEAKVSSADLFQLSDSLSKFDVGTGALPANRLLFNSGFQQLPPAGYLPVDPGKSDVAEQLSRIFGEGVRLHLRAARADVLPHLLEEAQHMERISLTQGLDDPKNLEDVEVFIPDGEVSSVATASQGTWWQTTAHLPVSLLMYLVADMEQTEAKAAAEIGAASDAIKDEKGLSKNKLSSGLRINRQSAADLDVDTATQDGITRTESREDGSFAFTTVVGIDLLDVQPEATPQTMPVANAGQPNIILLTDAPASNDTRRLITNKPDSPQADLPDLPDGVIYSQRREAANYLSADIGSDPFDLAVGQSAPVKLEWVSLRQERLEVMASQVKAAGELTVERRVIKGKQTLVSVQIEIQGSSVRYSAGQAGGLEPISGILRFLMWRQSDGQTGMMLVEDAGLNKETPALEADWNSAPQTATLTLIDRSATSGTIVKGNESTADGSMLKRYLNKAAGQTDKADATVGMTELPLGNRHEWISLSALAQMPTTSTAMGASALNVLTTLSDVMNDAAFLARAMARLFPQADKGRVRIKALRDWVMFRRLRPSFCSDVIAVPAPASVIEAFQVWHLKASSTQQLVAIAQALKSGNDKFFLEFPPKRVGVLRYRDDGTASEEGASREVAMWKQAKPGNMVAIARVWEGTPEAGQGWQNHFRLREMLTDIASLTTPPANGTGGIAVLDKVPPSLLDGNVDGGMLVVTIDKQTDKPDDPVPETPVKIAHRVMLMPMSEAKELVALLRSSADKGWEKVQARMNQALGGAFVGADRAVQFENGVLVKADAETLIKDQDAMIKFQTPGGGMTETNFLCLRVDAGVVDNPTRNTQQHNAIKTLLKAQDFDTAGPNTIKVTATDLGGGAQVASLVFIYANNIL